MLRLGSQPISTGAASLVLATPALESALKFTSKYDNTPIELFKRQAPYLLIPRNCAPIGVSDERTSNNLGAINCKAGPLDGDQDRVLGECLERLQAGRSFIVECPTGWGKTYIGSAVAAKLGEATVIVIPKLDLMKQWKKTLLNLVGVPESEIGLIHGKTCSYKGKRFVLASVHSMVQNPEKYPADMWSYFGLAIFDETHRMAAETFSLACFLLRAKLRLGLSATPNRRDGKGPVIEAHIGKTEVRGIKVPMKPRIIVRKSGWRLPRSMVYDPKVGGMVEKPMPCNPGRMAPVFKAMTASPARNEILVDFIQQAYKAGRTIVVIADMVDDQLVPMFMRLSKVLPAQDMGFYIGGKTDVELEIAASKRIVLATFGMCSEGTDYPNWDTLVPLNPRGSIAQALGRVIRFKEGKKVPVLFELVDGESIFENFYLSRLKEYYAVNADIVRIP